MNNVEPPYGDDESQVRRDRGGWLSGPGLSEDEVRLGELRKAHPGWTFWKGRHTGRWWAAPPPGLACALLDAGDLNQLEAEVLDVETWQSGG